MKDWLKRHKQLLVGIVTGALAGAGAPQAAEALRVIASILFGTP